MKNIIIGLALVFFGIFMLRFAKRTPMHTLKRLTTQSYMLGISSIIFGLWFIYDGFCEP